MPSPIEAQVAASAARFATKLAAELRRAPVSELLALATDALSARVEVGVGQGRPSPSRSPAIARQRIQRAVDELVVEHRLSEREQIMLVRVAFGALRDELAEEMGVARQTMKLRIRALLRKVGAASLGEVASRILHRAASFE